MKKLFDLFSAIYVTNLDWRPERMLNFISEMKKAGLSEEYIKKIKRAPGIEPSNKDGNLGCTMTHLSIIEEAKKLNLGSVLVFEDDAEYIPNDDLEIAEKIAEQLSKKEFALFYLGCNTHEKLEQVDRNLFRAKNCLATHALVYHHSIYKLMIDEFNKGHIPIIDLWLRDVIQTNFNCLGAYPPLFSQVSGFSDIQGKVVDVRPILDKFKKHTAHFV